MTTVDSTLDFDALTESATLAPSAPWSTNGQAPVVHAASGKSGKGVNWPSTATAGRVQYDYGSNQTARAVVAGSWFRFTTLPTASCYLNAIYTLATGGSILADWRLNTNQTFTLRNNAVAVATSTAVLAVNTWYWADFKADDAGNTVTLRIYDAAGTLIEQLSGSYTGTATRVAAFGPNVAAATGVLDMDGMTVADDFIGPGVANDAGAFFALM